MFCKNIKVQQLTNLLNNEILTNISKITLDKSYIINDCYYYNNWRASPVTSNDNSRLNPIINNKLPIKYIFKEDDIIIDELRINHILDNFFNKNFKKSQYENVFFIKHRHLTENDILCILTEMFYDNTIINNNEYIIQKINDLIYNNSLDHLPIIYKKSLINVIDNLNLFSIR